MSLLHSSGAADSLIALMIFGWGGLLGGFEWSMPSTSWMLDHMLQVPCTTYYHPSAKQHSFQPLENPRNRTTSQALNDYVFCSSLNEPLHVSECLLSYTQQGLASPARDGALYYPEVHLAGRHRCKLLIISVLKKH